MKSEKIYRSITPIHRAGDDDLDELKVCVDYELGGYSYWSGNYVKRGVYVYLKPVHRNGFLESTTIAGNLREAGFKICVKSLTRKSQKRIDEAYAVISEHIDTIIELWEAGDFDKLNSYIKMMCA